jgi:CBS domain-containing protein
MKKIKTQSRTLLDIVNDKAVVEIISVDASSPVMEALIIMAKFKIGALIVMNKNKMVGIISERDYAREMILERRSSKDTLVKEIMTKKVISLSANDTFEKGLEVMTKKRIRHMPIMDGKDLVGVVSQGDLVKEMIAYQKELIAELKVFAYERAW